MSSNKHENYEILNLIGYGLAKFDKEFIRQFNCESKNQFYKKMVDLNVAETIGAVKNRQDLFDPFFDNPRQGWWQKGNTYIHRKIYIDRDLCTTSSPKMGKISLYSSSSNSLCPGRT